MSDFAALLYGAVIIVFFSYERFNRTTYDVGKRLERLVSLLSPDKLRARRVVVQAWFFYTLALLIAYLMLCVYAQVLPALNIDPSIVGATDLPSGENEDGTFAIPASVSLGVALALVGAAPTVPFLKRAEDSMRVTAHRLAGIPTRVLSATDDLRRSAINLSRKNDESLLIPKGDWDRREHYRTSAAGQLTAPEDFSTNLDLIFAVSSWILDRRVKLENIEARERFELLEQELRSRKDVLILELDERTEFTPGRSEQKSEEEKVQPEDDPGITEVKRGTWERMASDADALAEDLCILLALYVEHELIPRETAEELHTSLAVSGNDKAAIEDSGSKTSEGKMREIFAQQDIARDRLMTFLQDIVGKSAHERLPSFTTMTLLWSLFLVMVVTLAWSQGLGIFEQELMRFGDSGSVYQRMIRYSIDALNGFCVPMLIALALRDAGRQSGHWMNVCRGHWTSSFPQIALALFASWAFAMFLVVAINLWNVAITNGIANNDWVAVRTAFESQVFVILRGSVLALFVIFLLDGHSAGLASLSGRPTWRASLRWALRAAAGTALIGAFSRTFFGIVSARVANPPRPGLDAIDYGLIFYSTLYSWLIGFVVIYVISEVLLNQWPIDGRRRRSFAAEPAE
ncbi:MAG: hypothetical protein R8G34_10790 [Paracoccaceae bacterium]|nr:hypothetical protein [Paracoccaceae bacterium]